MSVLDRDDVFDYRQVTHDGLKTIFMDGKMGGDGYLGMVLDGLRINIINMLEDCDDDVKDFKDAIAKVFDVRNPEDLK